MVYSFYGGFISIKVRQDRNERLLPVGILFYPSVKEILSFLSFSLQCKFDIFVRRNYEYMYKRNVRISFEIHLQTYINETFLACFNTVAGKSSQVALLLLESYVNKVSFTQI